MRVKLITFRYSATVGGFDDTPLREFIRDKEVLSFREHFYSVSDVPHLTCVVAYQDPIVAPRHIEEAKEPKTEDPNFSGGASAAWRSRPDPAAGLGEADRALFNTVREWRARKARDEGVPPYVILTNRQLLEIVRRRPESITALGHIDGLGSAKLKQYGEDILALLHGTAVPEAPPANEPPTAEPAGAAQQGAGP